MATKYDEATRKARVEAHRKYFGKLCEMMSALKELRWERHLDEGQLRALSICRLEDLDVDEARSCDFGPRYFAPMTSEDMDEMQGFAAESLDDSPSTEWDRPCVAGTDEGRRLAEEMDNSILNSCSPFHESGWRANWFMTARGCRFSTYGIMRHTCWDLLGFGERDRLPFFDGSRLDVPSEETYSFMGQNACGVVDESVPHATCVVTDSTKAPLADPLRSDLIAAICLLKCQTRRSQFAKHHRILPIMIFSFQHNTFGRISQMHFDGNKLFVRQSRQLDFSELYPNDDACIMLRWMVGSPIGDTKYAPVGSRPTF